MNKALITSLLLITIVVFSCRKDPKLPTYATCSECITFDALTHFLQDAQYLAYLEIQSDSTHIGYNSGILHPETVEYYLGRLSFIYNSALDPGSPLHPLIFDYNIHQTLSKTALNSIIIQFKSEGPEGTMNQFLSHPGDTDNAFLDEIYTDYSFTKILDIKLNGFVGITSEQNYNIRALTRKLKGTKGILNVGPDSYAGGNTTIIYNKVGDLDEFNFGYGWDDCIAGCIYKHYWQIRIDSECNITSIVESGDALPE